MHRSIKNAKGFVLIAALLFLVLLSGFAVGLMFMVHNEKRIGGYDLENNLAYYGAEAGMEKMTADLWALYTSNQAPTVANIQALGGFPPTVTNVGYPEYQIIVPTDGAGNPLSQVDTVHAGPNQGLYATIIPMTLEVTAARPLGDQVRMIRQVEVALIPVFQFGVFSDSDLSYFPGPNFDFAGRVHTNGHLFLSPGGTLTLHSKITAVGRVVRDTLANGVNAQASGHGGPVYVPNATAGCDAGAPALNCLNLQLTDGSWSGGVPPASGAQNLNWVNISTGTYNSWILDGSTGARQLQLPFVGPGVDPVQIIRRPAVGELPGSVLYQSRLYSQAQIRVLLADTVNDLHPGVAADADDILLDNSPALVNYQGWAAAPVANYPAPGVPVGGIGNVMFAAAKPNSAANGVDYQDYRTPLYFGAAPNNPAPPAVGSAAYDNWTWPLIGGYLRVEVRDALGNWRGVTREWLQLGFARGPQPPNTELGVVNAVNPNAILILQQQADRNGDGVIDGLDGNGGAGYPNSGANSQFAYYPINFYDAREGQVRDTVMGAQTGAVNGIMNAVELDVGNLRRWLTGAIGATGNQVDWASQNGYLLYFSDRRGMLPNPNVGTKTGEYGFEDTINSGSSLGTPNGALEPNNPGTTRSPEDVSNDGFIENFGAANVGDGFQVNTSTVPPNPFVAINTWTVGRANRVTGARHAIKLVNGTLGNLPRRPNGTGGFTVASENPLYIQGNYNATSAGWGAGNAAAGAIADTVTLLSNSWNDVGNIGVANRGSMRYPTTPGNRVATTTWYRVAIAAGKNINFPQPAGWAAAADYGTDGGTHNFLRYLENWGGSALNYQGSLVSLYYSQYATGIFKCCTTVYSPPTRNYSFDTLFLNPANLPPGTPSFRDVDNVSYRQDFVPQQY